jgi:hypothetical protein
MNTFTKFHLVGVGTTAAPLWFATQTTTEATGFVEELSEATAELDFSTAATSGNLLTLGVL